jgi:hypothetical protein
MGSVYLTDLADACRATGLRVIEEPGWKTRGHSGLLTRPQGILIHHTAAAASAYARNPYPSLSTVRDGRPDLDGPLAQLGLQRDLAVRVIAAGRCWHAGDVAETWQSNDHALGIEAEHDGVSPWPEDLYDAYVQLGAGLADWYNVPISHVVGHKEAAVPRGRKTDPNFSMSGYRTALATYQPPEAHMSAQDVEELKQFIRTEIYAGPRYEALQNSLSAANRAIAAIIPYLKTEDSVDDAELRAAVAELKAAIDAPPPAATP